ncbi:ankyrin-1-like [Mytilus trossulus]|uniref:ankyrin-1-like n=1 Tax=Mytilus trossulus TaxID=6551 RepID=UPI003004B821
MKMETEQDEAIPKNIRDQIENEIKEWEIKDKMFVTTRASEHVLECLQDNSCLTLTAPSGVGKSFIARHTALVLQKEGYKIIPVRKQDDIRDYYQPGKQTVFIIDDICGNFTANQQQIENWQQLLPVIKTIIADKCCKIIVSCRLQVYRDDKFNILEPFKTCECHLMSDKLCLTAEEKDIMASMYIDSSLDNIDKLSQNSEFFPLLCSLYLREKHGDVKAFFKNPFFVYQTELDSLGRHGDEGNYKICSLALLVLFNNQLKDKWIQGTVTRDQQQLIETTCDACGLNRGTSKAKLKEALLTLEGTFVHKQDGIYRTVHDKLFDFIAHYFGQKMIECLIDHADSDFVHERFIWRNSTDEGKSNIDFIIQIPDENFELYLERFIKDWSTGKVRVTFMNTNLTVSEFRQQLLKHLQNLSKSFQVTLANTCYTVFSKEHYGSGTTPLITTCFYGFTDRVKWILHNDVDVDQCRDDGISGLYFASQNGHTEIVKLLLERNPNVDLCDNKGCSPLRQASQEGHTDIVQLLLEKSPNIDLCDNDGTSPLCMASQEGHTDIVKLLLERNPSIDLCQKGGCSPLFIASQNGHTEIVKLLLERNPNIDLCQNNGCSPLYVASQNGNTAVVKLLLEKNPNIDLCQEDGISPLYIASENGHTDVVKLLLEKNPDIDLCQNGGCSPLYIASQNGNTDVVKLLLERNANVDLCQNDGCSPLYMASQEGYIDIVKLLLEKNPNVDICDKDGWTPLRQASQSPLYIASRVGHTDIVKLLLERNPNIDICSNDGRSPLYMTSHGGHTEIVKLLLEKNPNIDLCQKDGCSPLNIASQNGHAEIVKLLLERNPNIDLCQMNGCSPLYIASQNGHTEIAKLLLEKNPNIDLCDKSGWSPLYIASMNGHTEIVKLLLERNANFDLCDENGDSPLSVATLFGYTDIEKLLLKRNHDNDLCDTDG